MVKKWLKKDDILPKLPAGLENYLDIERFDEMKGQVWNVGDETLNHTKLEICETIKRHIPDWTFENNTTLAHDQDGRNYFVDYTKIRELGYTAEETLDQGIKNLIKVYKNNLAR